MQNNTLTIREYEKLTIGEKWDPASKTISAIDAAHIARHQSENGREIIRLGYRSAQATNWVGTLGIGRKCIEIVPKIDDPESPGLNRARENLLYMISRAGYVPLTPADIVRIADPNRPLINAFLDLYIENLSREWRRGSIKLYVTEEENRIFLRGKLLFAEQLRHNSIHQERFFTVCDEFTVDNHISRLLKAALKVCATQILSEATARKARGLLADFDDVSSVHIPAENLDQFQVDRQHSRFEPLIVLAKLILKSASPETGGDAEPVYSLVFDMNEVFERFVAAEMQSALAGRRLAVVPQMGGRSLLQKKGRGKFQLRPDIGIIDRDKVACLLDTKWKKLDQNKTHKGVSQADMYQMYAYGKEYDSPLVVLIYPRTLSTEGDVDTYSHHTVFDDRSRQIAVRTVDVSQPMGDVAAVRVFRDELLGCIDLLEVS